MFLVNSKMASLLLLALIGWLVFSLLELNKNRAEINSIVSGLQERVAETEKDRSNLEKFTGHLRSPDFLEREARVRLNYKAPDEEVVFVFRDPNPSPVPETNQKLDQVPNYQKWWYYLLGN